MGKTTVAFTTMSDDLDEVGCASDLCYEFVEGNSVDFVLHVVRFMRAMGYDDTVIINGFNGAAEELGFAPVSADAD